MQEEENKDQNRITKELIDILKLSEKKNHNDAVRSETAAENQRKQTDREIDNEALADHRGATIRQKVLVTGGPDAIEPYEQLTNLISFNQDSKARQQETITIMETSGATPEEIAQVNQDYTKRQGDASEKMKRLTDDIRKSRRSWEKPTDFDTKLDILTSPKSEGGGGYPPAVALAMLMAPKKGGITQADYEGYLLEYHAAYMAAGKDHTQVDPLLTWKAQAAVHNANRILSMPGGGTMVKGLSPDLVSPPSKSRPDDWYHASPKFRKAIKVTLGAVNRSIDLLAEAKRKGEDIAGAFGWLKAEFGGGARQLGYPITPLAENLAREFKIMQAINAKPLMQESRLSDAERKRVDDIVGKVSIWNDEVSLRNAMGRLVILMQELHGKSAE